jgi:hypothetical protein
VQIWTDRFQKPTYQILRGAIVVHGLETMKAMNESAGGEAVADVRFVMSVHDTQAVYIDGRLFDYESGVYRCSVGAIAARLNGRSAKIVNVDLSEDWKGTQWPTNYEELIPWIDTET